MSEQQALLLPSTTLSDVHNSAECDDTPWRTKTEHLLESRRFHIIVIVLIALDAACVLADLTYMVVYADQCSHPSDPPRWLEVLAHISLSITSLFLVEIPVSLWAFGLEHFNPFGAVIHAGLHLFDALIIVTTFILEVALKGQERELAGLLITLRLWRLVKLVGGIAVGAGEIEEEEARELAAARAELAKAYAALSNAETENRTLRQRLALLKDHL
ncbi:Voltage-gated hydrogen channel 1 [Hypsizygus marmoreus]|uniref:Voltage-gated hydrogen channel 1 n=1 Tax=Hypsizygus marmoreus TaxID=39966 RepID=A0A369JLJ3_HYPMA|nr:Voltage-gated hydrogen channel 1 [Hypsizygus marmoreus]